MAIDSSKRALEDLRKLAAILGVSPTPGVRVYDITFHPLRRTAEVALDLNDDVSARVVQHFMEKANAPAIPG